MLLTWQRGNECLGGGGAANQRLPRVEAGIILQPAEGAIAAALSFPCALGF